MARRPFRRLVSFLILLLSHPSTELRAQKSRVALAALRPSFVPFESQRKPAPLPFAAFTSAVINEKDIFFSLEIYVSRDVRHISYPCKCLLGSFLFFSSSRLFSSHSHKFDKSELCRQHEKNLLINVRSQSDHIYCAIYFNYEILFSISTIRFLYFNLQF